MASITELLDKLKNARATVELVEACGKRVCSSEEHWDCPYGNEGMTDCVDRLETTYEDTIENLLQLAEALSAADAAPVVHGRPVTKIHTETITGYHEEIGVFAADGANLYRKNMVHVDIPYEHCPVCGAVLCSRWHNYCGKCGAKMDGGADHEDD